jgi:hypothetical protein
LSLIGNYSVFNKVPIKYIGGTSLSSDRSNFNTSGLARNPYFGSISFDNKNSVPVGYTPPYSWVIAQTAGGMSTINSIFGVTQITSGNLAAGINISSNIEATGTLTSANLGLIVALVSNITGALTADSLNIVGILNAVSTFAATGTLTSSINALTFGFADLQAFATIASGFLTNSALLGSISMSASISISTGILTAPGFVSADISSVTELSPESLAKAIWADNLALQEDSGSYGKLLKQIKATLGALL